MKCNHVSLLTTLLLFHGASVTVTHAGQPPKPTAVQGGVKRLTFGDIVVVDYQRVKGNYTSSVQLTGSKTLITVPDSARRSTLVFHADEITLRKEKKDVSDVIEMKGNLRYTVTQKDPDGTSRILEGTAGTGNYRRADSHIELKSGVNAKLTDEARLRQPATIRAGRINVNIGATPFIYLIEGDASNDVRFAPKGTAPSASANAPTPPDVSDVHISRFRSGTFQAGKQAVFKGAGTLIELENVDRKNRSRFAADEVEAAFASDERTITRASGTGNVNAHVERLSPANKVVEMVDGDCERAVYLADKTEVLLKDKVTVTLTSPESLKEPAKLTSDQVSFSTGKPYEYIVSGNPQRSRLVFTPKPPIVTPPQDGQPAKDRFSFGTVTIEAFDKGEFVPGDRAQFNGEKLVFRSEDPQTKTSARVQCRKVVAEFVNEEVISKAELTGGIDFDVKRLDAQTKKPQAVRGKADHATFTNTAQAREVKLFGPLDAEVIDEEHLASPGTIRDKGESLLTMDLARNLLDFDIESFKETGEIKFEPREATPAPKVEPQKPIKKVKK